jgi:hypothetical protein
MNNEAFSLSFSRKETRLLFRQAVYFIAFVFKNSLQKFGLFEDGIQKIISFISEQLLTFCYALEAISVESPYNVSI